jgi:hypothetical protein
VTGCIVFLYQADGETLSTDSYLSFLRREASACGQSANIRQVLLQLILCPAFHSDFHWVRGFTAILTFMTGERFAFDAKSICEWHRC